MKGTTLTAIIIVTLFASITITGVVENQNKGCECVQTHSALGYPDCVNIAE